MPVRRYVSLWFPTLATDWFALRTPDLRDVPFVLKHPVRGRMVVAHVNAPARAQGITRGMALADARAILPGLMDLDDNPELPARLLNRLAEWCIRFTPIAAVDLPEGLWLDATGCTHLWGGEKAYLQDVIRKIQQRGYRVRAALAITPGAAWALARYGNGEAIVQEGDIVQAIMPLPPEALRLENEVVEKLHKLGLRRIAQLLQLPRASLRRRFGMHLLRQINRALGAEPEPLQPICPPEPYQERLPCLEPVCTAEGIHIALETLLTALCHRLQQEQCGLRQATFRGYRVDGKTTHISIGTSRPTHAVGHVLKLFQLHLSTLAPGWGIELFILEATHVEPHRPQQDALWENAGGLQDERLAELLDRLHGKINPIIRRYLPAEHYWPERSIRIATGLDEQPPTAWPTKMRPMHLLPEPDRIEVSAPIPDYPPMLFRYRGQVHKIVKADGPERIEQAWWLQEGQHRDYYEVEDEAGKRYWLFRLGHYDDKKYQWFIHGFFA